MLERKNAVVFLGGSLDACALWRLYMPHLSIPGSEFYIFAEAPDFRVIVRNDVIVVQRLFSKDHFAFLKTAVQLGMRIIYDLDDNMWDVPTYNPAYGPLTAVRDGFGVCIRMVDVVAVSTHTLAKEVRRHVKFLVNSVTGKEIPIVVAENKMYTDMFAPVRKYHDVVTVGWGGSASHKDDLLLVEGPLYRLADECKDKLKIQFRGGAVVGPLKNIVEHQWWCPLQEFTVRMPLWNWDIALAPLTDHAFNQSKSCIKMLEAAYCGIPCLASWVRPYEEFCHWDPELHWLLCAGSSQFEKKLRELIHDHAWRAELGRRSAKVLAEHYSYNGPHEGWMNALQLAVR